jgi:hypothetical protein
MDQPKRKATIARSAMISNQAKGLERDSPPEVLDDVLV